MTQRVPYSMGGTATDLEVGHGYSLADLNDMARKACLYDRSMATDADTRFQTAWSAIALAIVEAPHWPRRESLVEAGWRAIYAEIREIRRFEGRAERNGCNPPGSAPLFARYWYSPVMRFDEGLIDRLSVAPILATLTEREREAVVALATHGDYEAAAASMGLSRPAFSERLKQARRRFHARWYYPQTPPKQKQDIRSWHRSTGGKKDHCGKGHEFTPENTRETVRVKKGVRSIERVCRTCAYERNRRLLDAKKAAEAAA